MGVVPDLPCQFGLADKHLISVSDGGSALLAPTEKFGQRRIVDQIEKKVGGTDRLIGKIGAFVRLRESSQRGAVDNQRVGFDDLVGQHFVGVVGSLRSA